MIKFGLVALKFSNDLIEFGLLNFSIEFGLKFFDDPSQ
jgi:hypothetical protein